MLQWFHSVLLAAVLLGLCCKWLLTVEYTNAGNDDKTFSVALVAKQPCGQYQSFIYVYLLRFIISCLGFFVFFFTVENNFSRILFIVHSCITSSKFFGVKNIFFCFRKPNKIYFLFKKTLAEILIYLIIFFVFINKINLFQFVSLAYIERLYLFQLYTNKDGNRHIQFVMTFVTQLKSIRISSFDDNLCRSYRLSNQYFR